MLHGIAAGPAQFDNLTADLDERGIPWRAPVLPGHCTDPADLYGVTWRDWYEAALEAHGELESEYGEVAVAGFSIGALLAIMLAAERPVERLVLLNTPVYSFFRIHPRGVVSEGIGDVYAGDSHVRPAGRRGQECAYIGVCRCVR